MSWVICDCNCNNNRRFTGSRKFPVNMSSSVGMIIPNIWKNKTGSKPPTSNAWETGPVLAFGHSGLQIDFGQISLRDKHENHSTRTNSVLLGKIGLGR